MDERYSGKIITPAHEHDWITPKLAVGNIVLNYDDVAKLLHEQITHVLDLCGLSPVDVIYKDAGIVHFALPAPDDGKPREWAWLRDGVAFAHDALRAGSRVLVHCHAGISRSPSMVYAILRTRGMAAQAAEEQIVKNRPIAHLTYKACVEKHLPALRAHIGA